MGFQQATIKIEKEREFAELQAAMTRVFSLQKIETFLKRVQNAGLRVRLLEPILEKGILEKVDKELAASGNTGTGLYQALTCQIEPRCENFICPRWKRSARKCGPSFKRYTGITRNYEVVEGSWRARILSAAKDLLKEIEDQYGKGEIRAHQAARERGHDRSH